MSIPKHHMYPISIYNYYMPIIINFFNIGDYNEKGSIAYGIVLVFETYNFVITKMLELVHGINCDCLP